MKKKTILSKTELAILLKHNNIKVQKSYCHDDYMFTSFTMPYPIKDKLDRLCKQHGVTRSAFVRMLIETFEINPSKK